MNSFRWLGIGVLAFSGAAMAADTPVTFAKDIAPIFQEKCESCHRAGSMAPMSLVTYEETRPWAKSIKQRVATRQMPPWHIDKTVGVTHFAKRPVAQRSADRDHCEVGRYRRADGQFEGYASAEEVAGWERLAGGGEARPAGFRDQVDAVHHGRASSGCVVAGRCPTFR